MSDIEPNAQVEQVFVRYRDPSYEKDGELFMLPDDDWQPGPPWVEPDDCLHAETMCRECMLTWQEDHKLLVIMDGQPIDIDLLAERLDEANREENG